MIPERILIRKVDNLGDMILALPVISEICRHFSGSDITLMVQSEHRSLYSHLSSQFITPQLPSSLDRLLEEFDLIFNIGYRLPDNYVTRPIKGKEIIQIGIPDWRKHVHVYRSLLHHLSLHGVNVRYDRPKIMLSQTSRKRASEWYERTIPLGDKSFNVAVNPGSGFPKKRWPLDRYTRICRWLIETFNANIIILGADHEDQPSKALINALRETNVSPLVGKSLDLVGSILAHTDMHIGNDSGTSHLASAAGVPTVTIFGPTSAGRWRPAGRRGVVIYADEADCEQSGYACARNCEDQKCLNLIRETQVQDGLLFCINKYIDRSQKESLDSICISPHLELKNRDDGTQLSNLNTGHSCLIRDGWNYINEILNAVNATNSYTQTWHLYPKDKPLIDSLIMHRIIVTRHSVTSGRIGLLQ